MFLIAFTLLAFELLVTRLFSVIPWNHFAFLAISVALFGLGAEGIVVHTMPGLFNAGRAISQIRASSLLLALALWAVARRFLQHPLGRCAHLRRGSGIGLGPAAADPMNGFQAILSTLGDVARKAIDRWLGRLRVHQPPLLIAGAGDIHCAQGVIRHTRVSTALSMDTATGCPRQSRK